MTEPHDPAKVLPSKDSEMPLQVTDECICLAAVQYHSTHKWLEDPKFLS